VSQTDDSLTERITLRLSTEYVEALDALVDAGHFEHRSAALRAGVDDVIEQAAVVISKKARGGRERKHLPDGDGGTRCTRVDDEGVMEVPAERVAHLDLCRGCDPAVTSDHARGSGSSMARSLEGQSS
jgi:Arc/MetJ-type ribon-helix-helix transcriptional regulator